MTSVRCSGLVLAIALLMAGAAVPAMADDGCLDFKWDVSKERALFATAPAALQSGKDSTSAPTVTSNRLYSLQLVGQDQVAYKVSPPLRGNAAARYGGIAVLRMSAPGIYRIAMDLPAWVDVVADGALLKASDFQGQRECGAPHKIVEFDLEGTRPFILQVSNAAQDRVLLTVTPAPARKF